MIQVVQKGDPVLDQGAQLVPPQDIGSPHIQKIIEDMKAALEQEKDGVAIAAPQIGVPLRIFVISKRAFVLDEHGNYTRPPEDANSMQDVVFINPEIVKTSKKRSWMSEGCLSVRWLYGQVSRARKATVQALDEKGKTFIRNGSGLMAQIFQHETDHLNGELFIDKARDIEESQPS